MFYRIGASKPPQTYAFDGILNHMKREGFQEASILMTEASDGNILITADELRGNKGASCANRITFTYADRVDRREWVPVTVKS